MDTETVKQFQRLLDKQGFKFLLGSKVTKVETTKNAAKVTVEPAAGGDARTLDADVVLVAIGRRPYTQNLGLEAQGVAMDRGMVAVDSHFATNVPGIYAIGDVTTRAPLTPVAIAAGRRLSDRLFGGMKDRKLDFEFIEAALPALPRPEGDGDEGGAEREPETAG